MPCCLSDARYWLSNRSRSVFSRLLVILSVFISLHRSCMSWIGPGMADNSPRNRVATCEGVVILPGGRPPGCSCSNSTMWFVSCRRLLRCAPGFLDGVASQLPLESFVDDGGEEAVDFGAGLGLEGRKRSTLVRRAVPFEPCCANAADEGTFTFLCSSVRPTSS